MTAMLGKQKLHFAKYVINFVNFSNFFIHKTESQFNKHS